MSLKPEAIIHMIDQSEACIQVTWSVPTNHRPDQTGQPVQVQAQGRGGPAAGLYRGDISVSGNKDIFNII